MKGRNIPKSVTPEEFVKLIKRIKPRDKEFKVAALLAYGAGMRISEVKKCKKEHFRGSSIEIRGSKYGVDRVVPKPKGWREWMFDILPIRKTVRSIDRNFKTNAALAKLNPEYTFHCLRHGFATRLIESGVPVNHVQVLLGHKDISTTGIYLRARPMDALKSYEELF